MAKQQLQGRPAKRAVDVTALKQHMELLSMGAQLRIADALERITANQLQKGGLAHD